MKSEHIQLEADEKILKEVRKHWFVLVLQLAPVVLFALLPLILIGVLGGIEHIEVIEVTSEYAVGGALIYTAWLLIMWMVLFSIWTNYYLDVWTVTTKRLITVDQRGFFARTTGSFRLERLQDILVSVDGFLPTLLNYGTVEIQTAGEEKNFIAHGLPNPSELKALILESSDTSAHTNAEPR